MEHVIVRPVIALNVDFISPPPDTLAGKLAAEIKQHAVHKGWSRCDPEAWYVPLSDLQHRIEAVADFLLFEASYWHEFEVGGGFEIVTRNGACTGVTEGSVFYLAVDLADAVGGLDKENPSRRAFVENDRYLDLTLDDDTIRIKMGHRAKRIDRIELVVSAQELKAGMIGAKRLLQQFTVEIGPLLVRSTDVDISSHLVRRMFGQA